MVLLLLVLKCRQYSAQDPATIIPASKCLLLLILFLSENFIFCASQSWFLQTWIWHHCSSILGWKLPWTELHFTGLQKSPTCLSNWANTHTHTHTHTSPSTLFTNSWVQISLRLLAKHPWVSKCLAASPYLIMS